LGATPFYQVTSAGPGSRPQETVRSKVSGACHDVQFLGHLRPVPGHTRSRRESQLGLIRLRFRAVTGRFIAEASPARKLVRHHPRLVAGGPDKSSRLPRRPYSPLHLTSLWEGGSIFVIGVVAGAIALVLARPARLGLDLRGGTQIVLEAQDTELEQVDDDTVARTLEVLRRRVDQLGVSEPSRQRSGDRRVLIELPGVADPEEALERDEGSDRPRPGG
jgi:hypothetical protein